MSARIAAATGSTRPEGIMLSANGWRVTGSTMVAVKRPARSSSVGTRVTRVTPRVMRVDS